MDANAAIVCIQETKLDVIDQVLINEMLGSQYFTFSYLPAMQTRGGILIVCRAPDATLTPSHVGDFSVTVYIMIDELSWHLTLVYGPQADQDKVQFLDELHTIRASIPAPWMITGDFNLLLDTTDKSNANVNRRNISPFRRFIDVEELKDIHLHGRRYTWSNERTNPTLENLDRFLVSID